MIPTPNAVRCALRFTQGSLEAYNIINVLCPSPATSANLLTIAGVLQSWWTNSLRGSTPATVQWLGADLTALDSPGAPFLAYSNTGVLAGALAGGQYPPQVSLAVSLRTGLSGRSYRGRIYVIGVSLTIAQTDGLIPQANANAYATLWNNLRTSLASAGFPLCVVSMYSGISQDGTKIPRAAGIATVVTQVVVGRRLDTQSRRLPVEGRA